MGAIDESAAEFDKAYQKYRRGTYARTFEKWATVSVGGVATIYGALSADPVSKLIASAVTVTTRFVDKVYVTNADNPDEAKCCQHISRLTNRVGHLNSLKKLW